jgi:hypothetical protein
MWLMSKSLAADRTQRCSSTFRVLDGHVPSAEGDHLGAGRGVDIAQWCPLEGKVGVRHVSPSS